MEPTIDTSMPDDDPRLSEALRESRDDKISGDADRDEREEPICKKCEDEKINIMMHIKRVRSYLNSAHTAIQNLEEWCQLQEHRWHKRLGKR